MLMLSQLSFKSFARPPLLPSCEHGCVKQMRAGIGHVTFGAPIAAASIKLETSLTHGLSEDITIFFGEGGELQMDEMHLRSF